MSGFARVTCLVLLLGVVAGKVDLTRLREQQITLDVKDLATENVLGVPIVDPPKRIAGYFKLDRATKAAEMFYFFFQARTNPAQAPVVLWMTGGPGCSSELAVLYENGPYTFDKGGLWLTETKYGWDVTHNMIFVDQPINTGFSYSDDNADRVYGEKGVAEDMLDFFYHFYAAHPELANLPLYITGESYAGHYVPAVSHRVWLANKNKEGPITIPFKGLAIGSGLTEPTIQFDAYGDFALDNGLISQNARGWMSFWYPLCRLGNQWCESTNWDFVCGLGLQICMLTQFQPIMNANPDVNVYDYTKKCDGRLCYDFTAADKYLNLPSTKAALGVPKERHWTSCDYGVYQDFEGDWLHRFDNVLPEMMAEGIRVMIYAGDLDIICNYLGNRRWVDALDWYGSSEWDDENDFEWSVAGQSAGKVKHWGPLSFVQVYKAGHMVPMDQPLNGLAMLTAWTRNHSVPQVMGTQRIRSTTTTCKEGTTDIVANTPKAETVAELFARLIEAPPTAYPTTTKRPTITSKTTSAVVKAGKALSQAQRASLNAATFVSKALRDASHAASKAAVRVTQHIQVMSQRKLKQA